MPASDAAVSFGSFFQLGIEHIFTGYDHLLFLVGLLLVCTRWQSVVAIITSFTLGHCLTLGLATLGWIPLPASITEPMIAFILFFVGAENLWRRGAEPAGRWAVTLLFGLVHGFGFASVLRDLGIGTEGRALAAPLLAFNLGVEFGQIAFAVVVLPVVWRARRSPSFVKHGVPALSALVALFGLYWFMERILLT